MPAPARSPVTPVPSPPAPIDEGSAVPLMSPSLNHFAPAFVRVQLALQPVVKNANNPHFGNDFADLAAILKEALPLLNNNGFGLLQFPTTERGQLALLSILVHESGQFISATMPLLLQKADPQGEGSAITYGRRYAACAILGIRTADDDGSEASARPPVQQARRPERVATPKVDPPKTEGWDSAEHEAQAHKDIGHRLAQLPEDHPVRLAGRVMREKHGWPVALDRLAELRDLLDEAEKPSAPSGNDEKAPSPPEPPESPSEAPVPLPEPEKPKRPRGGPLVKCVWCGLDIKDEAAVPTTFHDKPVMMHGRCKAEVDEEKKATGGIDPPF
jgi:hypothetical protein